MLQIFPVAEVEASLLLPPSQIWMLPAGSMPGAAGVGEITTCTALELAVQPFITVETV